MNTCCLNFRVIFLMQTFQLFCRPLQEGDLVQTPYGDGLVTNIAETVFGIPDYIVQLFESGEYKICKRHEALQLDAIFDLEDTGAFDSIGIEWSDEDDDDRFELCDEIPELIDHLSCSGPLPPGNSEEAVHHAQEVPAASDRAAASSASASKKRFATMDSRIDLENLADERTAKYTANNTRWAVKIFKGKYKDYVLYSHLVVTTLKQKS